MLYVADVPAEESIEEFYRSYASFKYVGARRTALSRGKACRQSLRDPVVSVLVETGGLRGQRLLDIGCSYGRLLQLARAQGAIVHGVDLDEAAVEFLKGIAIPAGIQVGP
ncbi:MAG: class I SAM-dependent methyltransferase [Planctomycetota bacterium]|jgi:2-polyprenyl-3-methyl-5-hydroxy-6-metoxy-1,4-benzoquinol methylase